MTDLVKPYFLVQGLRSAFGGPFDLSLARGECISVLGASGSGKSVLLRLIADLDIGSGSVWLEGKNRNDWPAPEWRQKVVYQPAEPAWWASTAANHFEDSSMALVKELLTAMDMSFALLATEIERLSTGERQRLALVRSLAKSPAVLLLDEPTSSLDQASMATVESLLKTRLEAGLTIIWVTHSQDQAKRMSTRQFDLRDHQLHRL